MTDIATTAAAEINRLHELAGQHAAQAVEHAKRAGALLLQVKAQLPHGEFLPWVRANVNVTPRQAQRYIAAAQGKQPAPKLKSDTMSHLEVDAPRLFPGDPPVPEFLPATHCCYLAGTEDGPIYLVEPSSRHPGYLYVSRLNTDGTCDYTRRPVGPAWVEMTLQHFGLEDPDAAAWRMKPSAGVSEAMGTFHAEARA